LGPNNSFDVELDIGKETKRFAAAILGKGCGVSQVVVSVLHTVATRFSPGTLRGQHYFADKLVEARTLR
jgi:hypothetical protein